MLDHLKQKGLKIMNYKIRKATILDLDEIYNIQLDYEHLIISKNSLKDDLNNNICIYFVCLDENQNIVGAIGGTILVDHIDISIVITKKENTKKGIASYLLNELIQYSQKNHIEKIFLEVRCSNTPAINLYLKFKFDQISTRKNYYDNSEDALIYMLKTSESS